MLKTHRKHTSQKIIQKLSKMPECENRVLLERGTENHNRKLSPNTEDDTRMKTDEVRII